MSSFFWEQIFLPDLFTVVGSSGKICLAHWSCLINIYLETRWLSMTQWLELLFIFQLWNYILGNACCLRRVTVASPVTQTQREFTTQLSPHRGWRDLRAASQWCSWSPSSAFLLAEAVAWKPCLSPLLRPLPPIIATLQWPSPKHPAAPGLTLQHCNQWSSKTAQGRTPQHNERSPWPLLCGWPPLYYLHLLGPPAHPSLQGSNSGSCICVLSNKHSAQWRMKEDQSGDQRKVEGQEVGGCLPPGGPEDASSEWSSCPELNLSTPIIFPAHPVLFHHCTVSNCLLYIY